MKRGWKIVFISLTWILVAAFFVWAVLLRRSNESARTIESMQVVVTDSDRLHLITSSLMKDFLQKEGVNPVGKRVDEVDLGEINRLVESYCFTAEANTFVNYGGRLTVRLSQREPVLRFRAGDYDFYLTADRYVLPVRPYSAILLPTAGGTFVPPFPPAFSGSLDEYAEKNKKNSDKNYIFVCKLINFVRLVESDKRTREKFVQLVVSAPDRNDAYAQPEVELIPRDGDYSIRLGTLDDAERKIGRWDRFVRSGAVDLNGGVLDLRYDNQAVWIPDKTAAPKEPRQTP